MIRRLLALGCLFGVVATTIASWRLRWAYEAIAESGSGGLVAIKAVVDGITTTLLAGLAVAAVVLVVGLIRRRPARAGVLTTIAAIGGVAFLGLVVALLSATYYNFLAPLGVTPPALIPQLWTNANLSNGMRAMSHASLLQWVNLGGIAMSCLVGVAVWSDVNPVRLAR